MFYKSVYKICQLTCTPRNLAFSISDLHIVKLSSLLAVAVIWQTAINGFGMERLSIRSDILWQLWCCLWHLKWWDKNLMIKINKTFVNGIEFVICIYNRNVFLFIQKIPNQSIIIMLQECTYHNEKQLVKILPSYLVTLEWGLFFSDSKTSLSFSFFGENSIENNLQNIFFQFYFGWL